MFFNFYSSIFIFFAKISILIEANVLIWPTKNTKASDSTINDKQFKLRFYSGIFKFRSSDEIFQQNFGTIDDTLYSSYRMDNHYFKNRNVRCNKCEGTKVTLNSNIERNLFFK